MLLRTYLYFTSVCQLLVLSVDKKIRTFPKNFEPSFSFICSLLSQKSSRCHPFLFLLFFPFLFFFPLPLPLPFLFFSACPSPFPSPSTCLNYFHILYYKRNRNQTKCNCILLQIIWYGRRGNMGTALKLEEIQRSPKLSANSHESDLFHDVRVISFKCLADTKSCAQNVVKSLLVENICRQRDNYPDSVLLIQTLSIQ